MTEAEVIEAKKLRKAARSVFETQRALVRSDLGAASVGKRVATRIAEDSRFIAAEAADAANRNKSILAACTLALTGWLLRKPIMSFAATLFDSSDDETDAMAENDEASDNELIA